MRFETAIQSALVCSLQAQTTCETNADFVYHLVIKNTGSNSDGKSVGLMAPNGKAHESLMRKVYLEAGLKPAETGYVEVSLSCSVFRLRPHLTSTRF